MLKTVANSLLFSTSILPSEVFILALVCFLTFALGKPANIPRTPVFSPMETHAGCTPFSKHESRRDASVEFQSSSHSSLLRILCTIKVARRNGSLPESGSKASCGEGIQSSGSDDDVPRPPRRRLRRPTDFLRDGVFSSSSTAGASTSSIAR